MYHAIAVQFTTPPGQVTCKTTAVRTAGWVPEVRCEILASWMLGKTNKQTNKDFLPDASNYPEGNYDSVKPQLPGCMCTHVMETSFRILNKSFSGGVGLLTAPGAGGWRHVISEDIHA